MNFIRKSILHYISQFMVFKIFQNRLFLYQWHHITFYVKKITQLNILVNIMSPYSYDMDCDTRFLALQKSNILSLRKIYS
jgi:hypothetical protein